MKILRKFQQIMEKFLEISLFRLFFKVNFLNN